MWSKVKSNLRSTEARTQQALNDAIAASLAGGLRQNFGTMTKPLHAGNAARNGVFAASLARKGFTADRHILESPFGYVKVFGGTAAADSAVTAHIWLTSRIGSCRKRAPTSLNSSVLPVAKKR